MPAPGMKFSEFVDLLLVRLYELDQTNSNEFVDLSSVAAAIKADIPDTWLFDAGKVLQSRSLADCLFTFGGALAKISGEGRLYVEEGRGITKQVQQSPATYFVTVSGDNNQVVAGGSANTQSHTSTVERERSPVFRLIDESEQALKKDTGISPDRRDEGMTYLELVRKELRKDEPNRNVIAAVLDPLSKISSIAGNIATFIKLFNASL